MFLEILCHIKDSISIRAVQIIFLDKEIGSEMLYYFLLLDNKSASLAFSSSELNLTRLYKVKHSIKSLSAIL